MSTRPPPAEPAAKDHAPCSAVARIVAAARRQFTALGFSRITMDDLATELGMSKKTLYAHFPGKEALIARLMDAKIAEIRTGLLGIVEDPELPVLDRAHRIMAFMVRQMSEISPVFLRDLERFHPALFARMESVRAEMMPRVWGRLLHEAAEAGLVRRELDPVFISELMTTTVQGLLRPASLDRLQLPPHEVIDRILTILFNGILTPAGRKVYEKGPTR